MASLRRFGISLSLALSTALALQVAALAASYSDTVTGSESSATCTVGTFSGTATGGLPGTWTTTVDHTTMCGVQNSTITGGTFSLAATIGTVTGVYTGGTVTQTGGYTGCKNQTYAVNGNLGSVGVGGGTGTGQFSGTLTHYRFSFFGWCITYAARVSGTVNLSF